MDKNLKSDVYNRKILEKTEILAEIITFALFKELKNKN